MERSSQDGAGRRLAHCTQSTLKAPSRGGAAGQNDGNIWSIANGTDPTGGRNQSYAYDSLNRVVQGGDNAHWGETCTYDSWGNMTAKTVTLGSGYQLSVTANANNQLSNMSYDAAGEVIADQFGDQFT